MDLEELGVVAVFDDEDMETPYYIDDTDDAYFNAYVIEDGELEQIARIRYYNNHMAPYENLDTGVLYDSVAYLCDVATDYAYSV